MSPRHARHAPTALDESHAPATAVDPVCGMAVDTADALFADRDGARFYFCGPHCRDTFLAQPGSVTGSPVAASAADGGDDHEPAKSRARETGKAKDPVCGMVVDKATALRSDQGSRT